MKNVRIRNLLQLFLNLICLVAVVYGMVTSISKLGFNNLDTYRLFYLDGGFFTGAFIAICAFLGIILNVVRICTNKNIKTSFVYFLSFSTAVLSIGSIAFLGAYGFQHATSSLGSLDLTCLREVNFQNICLVFISPAVFACSFLFFSTEKERKIAHVFDGPILSVAFVLYSIIFASLKMIPDYYVMFDVNQFLPERWYLILTIFVVLMIGPFFAGLVFFSINNFLSQKAIEVKESSLNEPVVETSVEPLSDVSDSSIKEDEPKIEIEPEIEEDINAPKKKTKKSSKDTKKTKSSSKKEKEEVEKDLPRVYHISKRSEDNMWQVKFANGKRAVKLFKTQAEAMDYAKQLANSNGGSIRVHSLKGKIRKA